MEGHLGRFKLGTILNTGLADSMQIIKADLWDAIQAACKNVYSKHIESPTNSLELQTYDTNLRKKNEEILEYNGALVGVYYPYNLLLYTVYISCSLILCFLSQLLQISSPVTGLPNIFRHL